MSTTSHLDRMLEPVTDAMSREFAQKLIDLRVDKALQARVEELRRKANDGSISADEDAEYKDFVEAVDVISVLQAKARQVLVRQDG